VPDTKVGFAGRTALVTGASRGIGLEVARLLGESGANVVMTARDEDVLAAASASISGPGRFIPVAGNTNDQHHRQRAIDRATEEFGGVDILVLNAGSNRNYGPLLETSLDDARKTVEINVLSTLGWMQAAFRSGQGRTPKSVVIVASAAGLRPSADIGVYGATKAALIYLTAQLALELAPEVRVNAVAPAVVKTSFAQVLYADEETVTRRYPLKRLGEPRNIADAVLFLAGESAGWITGQALVIDGGLLLTGGV
jgi:NAD(P)-dependent dehydrogenase (short-subunit alcohol dehydrogenase family)